MKLSGKRPSNLGVQGGKLARCPNKPNCVSSQANDPGHVIAPLAFDGAPAQAMHRLADIVKALPRTTIIEQTDVYLYAECATALMGFVDDVEFYCDGTLIHARSASRLGYSDFKVNRKRLESIRSVFESK